MGFINWNGNKEEHYNDVVEFARMRQEEERRRIEEKQIRTWFGDKLGHPGYAKIESGDLIKYMVVDYKKMYHIFKTANENISDTACIDSNQLWIDFWMYFLYNTAIYFLPDEKTMPFIQVFMQKILRISSADVKGFHHNYKQTGTRYYKYFHTAFDYGNNLDQQFWRWICVGCHRKIDTMSSFIFSYEHFQMLLFYYLYLTNLSNSNITIWKNALLTNQQKLHEIHQPIWIQSCSKPNIKALVNPIYGKNGKNSFDNIIHSMRMIIFKVRKRNKTEKEFIMVEELYLQLRDNEIPLSQIESIIPESVKNDILAGKLPEFPHPDITGLEQEETLYYLNHSVLYQGKETEEGIRFHEYKGTLYFTDKKVMFRGNGSIDIPYGIIDRVIEYDSIPEFLELKTGNKSNFFHIPDVETAYRVLKLIANRETGNSVVKVNAPFSYEELVEKADLKACIFTFEYAVSGDMPEELRDTILELNSKLRGLQKTIEKYPYRKEEIYQFLKYYVPEAVKVVTSYQNYQGVGLERDTMNHIYEKVLSSVRALEAAVIQKIIDMYHMETMDTVARAEALKEILGQDGFIDPTYKL